MADIDLEDTYFVVPVSEITKVVAASLREISKRSHHQPF